MDATLLKKIVNLANSNAEKYKGKKAGIGEVRELIDTYDLVFGVWQDPTEPKGVGFMVIKGTMVLSNIVDNQISEELTVNAISLRCQEEGVAMQQVLGLPPS